ncbi:MAG: hypothetical protein KOO62_09150 [candidate division Zixibacteria bacterium]|nr:hypothetical protein [candidate division Zixibacteria bacterium]
MEKVDSRKITDDPAWNGFIDVLADAMVEMRLKEIERDTESEDMNDKIEDSPIKRL